MIKICPICNGVGFILLNISKDTPEKYTAIFFKLMVNDGSRSFSPSK